MVSNAARSLSSMVMAFPVFWVRNQQRVTEFELDNDCCFVKRAVALSDK
jgi:hypothetical protein